MQKKILSVMVAAGLALPVAANAMEVVGKKLEVYGKLHVSVDSTNPDVDGEDTQTSVSSNSSRLGFKGQIELDEGLTGLYKIEQEISADETGGEFATRNTYAGLKGGFGLILVGHHDTPVKTVGSRWGMFGDTVADRRNILGAASGTGNKLNDRGENAIMYKNTFSAIELQAMYSTSNPTTDASGDLDDNETDMSSVALFYNEGPLYVGVGHENWSDQGGEEVKNTRAAVSYSFGAARLGAIYENTDSDVDDSVWDRNVMGVNGSYKFTKKTDVRVQYLVADEHEGGDDTGASMASIGLFNKLGKNGKVYAIYTATNNEDNAQYQGVDGGHGDEVDTGVAGTNPTAFSVGYVLKF